MIRFLISAALAALSLPAAAANLITNGNFESGNSGFTSGYGYIDTAGAGRIGSEGQYTVTTNANVASVYADWGPLGPQSGSLALYANGAPTTVAVWTTTISGLALNTTYTFSFYGATVNNSSSSLSQLEGDVNGLPLFTFIAPSLSYVFGSGSFNTGGSSSVILAVRNLNTAGSYNDFAIDNLSLSTTAIAAPGPIAGAGLVPLLGLAGAFLFRGRKAV